MGPGVRVIQVAGRLFINVLAICFVLLEASVLGLLSGSRGGSWELTSCDIKTHAALPL